MNPRSINPDFGVGLRQLREAAGLTVVAAAEQSGISRSNVHRLEAGEIAEPSLGTLNALAKVLGNEPEDLYDLAWQTTGNGPGLPSLPTYFRAKYGLGDDQIAAVERALKRATKDDDSKCPAKSKRSDT